MESDSKLNDKQQHELAELQASLVQEGLFARRKYPSIEEARSTFILSVGTIGFLVVVLYWRGHIQEVTLRLAAFCVLPALVAGSVSYRWVTGTAPSTAILFVAAAASWLLLFVVIP